MPASNYWYSRNGFDSSVEIFKRVTLGADNYMYISEKLSFHLNDKSVQVSNTLLLAIFIMYG